MLQIDIDLQLARAIRKALASLILFMPGDGKTGPTYNVLRELVRLLKGAA